ncbi:GCN5-related N-acetyltransferase (modular protein) [Paraburkholderia ribeironis]|uniref:GCN5-related N-acetyltransferase (Modular protein) n=1 Tax=Paraburkholderia ribeironis TaxID=1247936 RepID=A0A1N7S8Q7_9BURK|nr:GNAT family N-acetyltransferase [Paraburkholderia ribeironis]SIT43754.1 GCN5-related N-acetyltransferase (modular protein) [Paraburkholderia ribeironis]
MASNSCYDSGCPLKDSDETPDDSRSDDVVAWQEWSFATMPIEHLYAAITLRESIFVVEQDVPYLDADGRDPLCHHIAGFVDDQLVAYLRVLPKGLFEPGFHSFGRVVVHRSRRHAGIGRQLVARGLAYINQRQDGVPIKISSQLYLKDFYGSFGFEPRGEPYIEDRILHIEMVCDRSGATAPSLSRRRQ